MLTKEQIIDILKEAGVYMEGHFLLTSGKHSNKYLQCAKIFQNTKYSEPLCAELAEHFKNDNIELVVGPALGAVQMAYEVSRALKVENFFTERVDGVMSLRRGFSIKPGTRCLIVEDVVTTGGSVKEVIEIIEQNGGVIAGIGSIVDRTGGKIDFGYDYKSVISMEVQAWEKENCPLCQENKIELVKPGSRKI